MKLRITNDATGGLVVEGMPDFPPVAQATGRILAAIADERDRQDAKWSSNRSMGMVHPIAYEYEFENAEIARSMCDAAAEAGQISWTHILAEEIAESIEAMRCGLVDESRMELVQVAAVVVAMIEDIDRRIGLAVGLPKTVTTFKDVFSDEDFAEVNKMHGDALVQAADDPTQPFLTDQQRVDLREWGERLRSSSETWQPIGSPSDESETLIKDLRADLAAARRRNDEQANLIDQLRSDLATMERREVAQLEVIDQLRAERRKYMDTSLEITRLRMRLQETRDELEDFAKRQEEESGQ